MIRLITSEVIIKLGVSCLILLSQHYHQVIHNRGQHGSSRRLNPAGVHYCSRTRKNDPPGGNQTHQADHSTQPNSSSHQAQSTTCYECTVNQAPTHPGDPHNMLSACLAKCRLQKIHLGTRGTHLHMMQQMESLN